MPSMTDDWNRMLNQVSQRTLESPTLGRIAALNPDFMGAEANRRAAIEARYPPTGIAAPAPAQAPATPAASRSPMTLSSITAPAPANLSPLRDLRGISVMDQGDGGTVEGNVAAIDRQTAALRDLNQARLDDSRFRFGASSIGEYGKSIGDDVLDRDRFLRQFQRPKDRLAAQDLLARGSLQAADLASRERIAQGAQQAGLLKGAFDAQTDAARQQFERAKWGQQLGLDQARFGLDQQKAALDAARQGILDQSTLAKNARPSPNDIKAELMRRYLAGGEDSAQALEALRQLFPTHDLSMLFGAPAQ